MTGFYRLVKFKSACSRNMSKAALYGSIRLLHYYYSGQQCAKAGIQCLWVYLLINDLLDIRLRGYDMISVLEFHVYLQFNIM